MNQSVQKALDTINKLIFVKQYELAWEKLDDLVKKGGAHDDLIVHVRRIELGSKLRKLAQLYSEYERSLTAQPHNQVLEMSLYFVELHGDMLTPEEAIAKFQGVLKRDPKHAPAYYGVAFSLELQGNIDRAIFNYHKSIELDGDWYPSYFGLSQLYYQKADAKLGDQFFLMFEKAAPYNVYGNFETHRALSREFFEKEEYEDAETAIASLSEWWIDNKGTCPIEIQIYEYYAIARINTAKGDTARADARRSAGTALCETLLSDPQAQESVVYFVARTLEDFGEFDFALRFYKKALRIAGNNPAMVQKIGGQFLTLGEYQLALDLFNDAYEVYADNPEIRFCILVSRLKLANVNVEDYLIGKERLKQLLNAESDRVEILALLHSLLAKFQDDPDVHMHIADVYLRLGNTEKAGRHFKRMYELDKLSRQSCLRYIGYHMHHGDPEEASRVLDRVAQQPGLTKQEHTEVQWLRANFHARRNEYSRSQEYLRKAIHADPWNVSYVVQEIINLTEISDLEPSLKRIDATVEKLARLDETNLDWQGFEALTQRLQEESVPDLIYARHKLRFLYADGEESFIRTLVNAACAYDPQQGTYDFLKLINTNFDTASVYWALGVLHKELWQLEVATMWFEQTTLYAGIDDELKASCLMELADCNIWLERNTTKAIEYAKLAIDLGVKDRARARNVLTHGYIKSGQVKLAEAQLSESDVGQDFDATYLRGLIEYRNGARKKANEIWKPLLSRKSETIRAHTIKQEILRYYFDGAPYLKVN